eukprot:Hpha_TRINITY_DN16187_c4_g2::TRINITY_DN16187_c4_g2_i2::g.6640::m.6640/K18752/TNPO1, IPO2, KPNB2; transportin-1
MTGAVPYTPSPAELQQVAQKLYQGFQQAANVVVQGELVQWLTDNRKNPAFNLCLAIIAATPSSGLDGDVRSIAALQLKRNICVKKVFDSGIAPIMSQIQPALISALRDAHAGVRRAAAVAISSAVRSNGIKEGGLLALVSELWTILRSTEDPTMRLGVLTCVCEICEDAAHRLDMPDPSNPTTAPPSVLLFQGLVQLITTEKNPDLLARATESIFNILETPLALARMATASPVDAVARQLVADGSFLAALDNASRTAGNPATHNHVLRVYRLLLNYQHELRAKSFLAPMLQQVFQASQAQSGEEVTLSACEFWADFAKKSECVQELVSMDGVLPQVVSLLLSRMPYSELEIAMLQDDEQKEDLQVSRMMRRRKRAKRDGEDDGGDDDGTVDEWTVRKASALALDTFAATLQDRLVTPPGCQEGWLLQAELLPRLQAPDWKQQEVAVLALGAIALGCSQSMKVHLENIVQLLLHMISDNAQQTHHYLVRSMACWTLSRFDGYIASHPDTARFFDLYLGNLLQRLTDKYRRVQECAVSAFASLIDSSTMDVVNPKYLGMITQCLSGCLQTKGYTTRNMTILLDAIGTLVWASREQFWTDVTRSQLMDPLFKQILPTLPAESPLMSPILCCVRRHAEGLGGLFGEYLPSVYPRVLGIIGSYWTMLAAHEAGQLEDAPDEHQACFSLRLCACLVMELREEVRPYVFGTKVPGSNLNLLEVALIAIDKCGTGFERSMLDASVCFLVDACKSYPEQTIPMVLGHLTKLLSLLIHDDPPSNNIVWFCGELCMLLPKANIPQDTVNQCVGAVANAVVPILLKQEWHHNILQQCALTVCRLAHPAPQLLAAQLSTFLAVTCEFLQYVYDTPAKITAIQGLLIMLRLNMAVLQDPANVTQVANVLAYLRWRPADLQQMICELLSTLKEMSGASWGQVLQCFPVRFPRDLLNRVDPSISAVPPPPPAPPQSMLVAHQP